jgi:hypothetical protein
MREGQIDYSDISPLDSTFLKKATTQWPPVKKRPDQIQSSIRRNDFRT